MGLLFIYVMFLFFLLCTLLFHSANFYKFVLTISLNQRFFLRFLVLFYVSVTHAIVATICKLRNGKLEWIHSVLLVTTLKGLSVV